MNQAEARWFSLLTSCLHIGSDVEVRKACGRPARPRRATRETLLLAAAVNTVGSSSSATLHDLSATGARLAGSGLPLEGCQLLIRTAGMTIFGDVAWQTDDGCGVKFDEPLSKHEIGLLRKEGRELRLMVMTPEERQAADDWSSGFAR